MIGIGCVNAVEWCVSGIDLGQPPTVNDPFSFDSDALQAEYVLSRKIDFRLNGIGLGSMEKDVRYKLGKAKRVDLETVNYEAGARDFKEFYFDGLFIGTSRNSGGDFSVDVVEVEGANWRFNGIGIGSSIADVKEELGEPFRVDEYKLFYNPPQTGASLEFEVEDGRVVKIKTGYGRC